jgi:hypothetical protein
MALGIVPGVPDLATKAFADLKISADRATRNAGQVEIDVLTQGSERPEDLC